MSLNVICASVAWLGLLVAPAPSEAQQRCSDPEADQWVRHIYGWTRNHDELALHAIEKYGPPEACFGEVTSEFDGVEFGFLRMEFEGGAVFEVETLPPESSTATLSDSSGLGDESSMWPLLKKYTADIGVDIDWTSPTVEEEERNRVVTFWDPEQGLNASVRLRYIDSTLVSVGFSLAL